MNLLSSAGEDDTSRRWPASSPLVEPRRAEKAATILHFVVHLHGRVSSAIVYAVFRELGLPLVAHSPPGVVLGCSRASRTGVRSATKKALGDQWWSFQRLYSGA